MLGAVVGGVGSAAVSGVYEEGDDGIVPSTPTLYVPRRNDGYDMNSILHNDSILSISNTLMPQIWRSCKLTSCRRFRRINKYWAIHFW